MLALGGKLSTPKKRGADMAGPSDKHKPLNISDPVEAQKVSLKMLGTQEKLLLVELQRTRQSIVEELSRLDPVIASNQWDQVQHTIQGYKERIVNDVAVADAGIYRQGTHGSGAAAAMMSKSLDTGKIVGKGSDLMAKLRTGIDMLPVLANTGDAALEMGLKRQAKLKLPIFKLPAVDPSRIKSTSAELSSATKLQKQRFTDEDTLYLQSLMQSNGPTPSAEKGEQLVASFSGPPGSYNHSINYKVKLTITDPLLFLQALGSMLSALPHHELGHIKTYVKASRQQLLHAEAECRMLYAAVATHSEGVMALKKDKRRSTSGRQLLQLMNFCKSDKCTFPSVFAKVKQDEERARVQAVARLDRFASSSSSSSSPDAELRAKTASSAAGAPKTSAVRIGGKGRAGASLDDAMSLGRGTVLTARSVQSRMSKAGLVSSFSPAQANTVPSSAQGLHRYQRQQLDESSQLKAELLQSLQSMSKHTVMVKEGILGVQKSVSAIAASGGEGANSKTRSYMVGMAAEKLAAALWRVVKRELATALRAWALAAHQERARRDLGYYSHFQLLRQVASALGRLAHRVINKKLLKWKAFTRKEVARLRAERERVASTRMQRMIRGYLARVRVAGLRDRKKYERLYKAVIYVQKIFRGKVVRWKYVKFVKERKVSWGCRFLQRVFRGHLGRRRARLVRLRRDKHKIACRIQKVARGRLGRNRVKRLRKNLEKIGSIRAIQRVIRGFLGRRRAAYMREFKWKIKAAVKIQAVMRGVVSRMSIRRRRAAMVEYRRARETAATKIQCCFRGLKGRRDFALVTMEAKRKYRKQFNAATKINNMLRAMLARRKVKRMRKQRQHTRLFNARSCVETLNEDTQQWYYYNESTGESFWEPPRSGYTKADGLLVLETGQVIQDPDNVAEIDLFGDDDDARQAEWERRKMCSECESRVGTRYCKDCGDKFCTKCFKSTHASGTRREHQYSELGPLDCAECEDRLAERWCVSCDEHFCDECWRKVHTRGKRRFHPFSEVAPDGKIDPRIFTIDGSQLQDYDPTYAQQRLDEEGEAPAEGSAGEWVEAYDDDGNIYYFNQATGVSQYEYPEGLGY